MKAFPVTGLIALHLACVGSFTAVNAQTVFETMSLQQLKELVEWCNTYRTQQVPGYTATASRIRSMQDNAYYNDCGKAKAELQRRQATNQPPQPVTTPSPTTTTGNSTINPNTANIAKDDPSCVGKQVVAIAGGYICR